MKMSCRYGINNQIYVSPWSEPEAIGKSIQPQSGQFSPQTVWREPSHHATSFLPLNNNPLIPCDTSPYISPPSPAGFTRRGSGPIHASPPPSGATVVSHRSISTWLGLLRGGHLLRVGSKFGASLGLPSMLTIIGWFRGHALGGSEHQAYVGE